jgi:hypothetical protein
MAFEYVELQETRNYSEAAGKVTASRKFRCWDDASPIETPAEVRDHFGDELPSVGSKFPDENVVYCTSYSISHVPDMRNTWEVTFNYENTEFTGQLPQEEGYVQITVDYAAEFRDVWRLNPNIPQYGTQTGLECGGTKIDKAGEPISVLARMSDLTIVETVSASSFPDRSLLIRQARGRRNLTQFQGAPIGQVLYTGATANRIGIEKYQITHRFRQDEAFHMIQSPLRDQLGKVRTQEDGPFQIHRAKWVDLVQPFSGFADFNLLSENF